MVGMKKYVTLRAAGVCLLVALGVRVAASPVLPIRPRVAPVAQEVDALRLYRLHCQMCHGANGKSPNKDMAFVGRTWKHGTSSADMAKTITEGVKGTLMVSFKGKLKPEQIQALAKFVRAFDKTLPPEK